MGARLPPDMQLPGRLRAQGGPPGVARVDIRSALTATHASTVYALTAVGLWQSFAGGAVPVTDLGLQVEPAGTNLSTVTEGTGALPSTNGATIAASSSPGPNNGTSFYALITSTANGGYKQANVTVPNDTLTRTRSVHIRKTVSAQTCRVLVGLTGGTGLQSFADINLATGAVVGGATAGAVYDGGDYWRIPVSITNNGTGNTTLFTEIIPVVGGTGSCEAGGLQLEVGSYMTSYMPAGLARSAVTASRSLESAFGMTTGIVRIDAKSAPGIGSGNQVLWQADDGTANNRLTIYRDTSRNLHCAIVSGGVTQSDRSLGPVADSTSFFVHIGWSGTTALYSLNGGASFTDYGVTMPSGLTTERVGCDTTGNQWGGRIVACEHYRNSAFAAPLFGDSFNRADTAAGSLGTPPSGVAYTMYGPYAGSYPLPAATAGQISGKKFIAPANSVVYATQNLGQPVKRVSMKVSWTANGGLTALSTPTILLSPDSKIIDTIIGHCTVNRGSAALQKRIAGGAFITLASITFSPTLKADGTLYDVTFQVSGTKATLTVAGQTVTADDPDFANYSCPYVGWEHFNNSADMVDLATIWNVAASA